jgi:hypothetical protein
MITILVAQGVVVVVVYVTCACSLKLFLWLLFQILESSKAVSYICNVIYSLFHITLCLSLVRIIISFVLYFVF